MKIKTVSKAITIKKIPQKTAPILIDTLLEMASKPNRKKKILETQKSKIVDVFLIFPIL